MRGLGESWGGDPKGSWGSWERLVGVMLRILGRLWNQNRGPRAPRRQEANQEAPQSKNTTHEAPTSPWWPQKAQEAPGNPNRAPEAPPGQNPAEEAPESSQKAKMLKKCRFYKQSWRPKIPPHAPKTPPRCTKTPPKPPTNAFACLGAAQERPRCAQ